MPEWTMRNAVFAAFLAVGAGPVCAMEWLPELQVQGRYFWQEYYPGSPLSPERFSSVGNSTLESSVLFSPKVVFNPNVQGFLSTAAGWRWNGGTDRHQVRLLEGGVSLANNQQTERITLGRMKVRWSQDSVYHPLDLFGRYNQPKSSLGISELDDFTQEGLTMARWQSTHDTLSYEAILADAKNSEWMPASHQAALRGIVQKGESEFSLIAEKSAGYLPRWGAGLSQGLGEQWTLYGEYLLSRERDLPSLQQISAEIPLSAGRVLPARYAYQRDDNHRNWQKALLTLRFYPLEGGSLEGSLFYNGHGMDRREWSQWERQQQVAAVTLMDPGLAPYLSQGNPYIPMLGDSARLMQNFYLRRFYASVRLDSLERFTRGSLEMNAIVGLEDGSTSFWATGQYPVSGKLMMKPFLLLQSHVRGEGKMAPVSAIYGLNFTWVPL